MNHTIPALPFRADGSFVIVQLTDLHLTNGGPQDEKTLALVETVLEREQPDLVVLTGDIIAGADEAIADSARAWGMAVAPMERRGLRWAAVFGNHDDEGDLSRAELMQVQRQYPHCLSQPGPAGLPGVGNYVIDLVAGPGMVPDIMQDKTQDINTRLYFIDSLAYGPKEVSRYAWISEAQIGWFREQANTGGNGLVFFHIPLPEWDAVWNAGGCVGNKLEKVCCPSVNSGMFAALRESGAVAGVFVGHDHINDYEGTLDGIRLCYGRAGGYGSYGSGQMLRGARVIRVWAGQAGFETWLRLEDGN